MPYAAEMYEQFGRTLLRMGDDLQAGKFLFLSGKRDTDYEAAIRLFVSRYAGADWQTLVSSFPAAVRRCSWGQPLEQLQRDLIALGVPRRSQQETLWKTLRRHPPNQIGWRGCLLSVAFVVGIGLVVSVVIGFFYDV